MNKKIKIIELYNLIANEEKIPKKIKYDGEVYHHNRLKTNYFRDDNGSTLSYVDLNDEVEILEDNTEEIEELPKMNFFELVTDEVKTAIAMEKIKLKVDELVKAVNSIRKDLNK